MIANLAWHALSAPGAVAALREDPALLVNAVEESLRLEPAAARVDRFATGDVELAGAPIREGDLVVVSLSAANRDPAYFPDPDRFDVHRENARHHAAFAHGPHVCLINTETKSRRSKNNIDLSVSPTRYHPAALIGGRSTCHGSESSKPLHC